MSTSIRFAGVVLIFGIGLMAGLARAQNADVNDPKKCPEIWSKTGLPISPAGLERDTTYVCHLRYIVEHNNEMKTPDWVIERLTPDIVTGDNDRPNVGFKAEPNIAEPAQAVPTDYAKSDFAIGHQAPSADFKSADALMRDTFFLSNAVPQVGIGFNTGIWSTLEGLVQKLAMEHDEIFVITGPVYQSRQEVKIPRESDACHQEIVLPKRDPLKICKARNLNRQVKCPDGVAVPAALFKVVYFPGQGVNAFVFPNVDHRPLKKKTKSLEYLKQYRVGLNSVEALTGYRFLTKLSARRQRQLKEECVATFLH